MQIKEVILSVSTKLKCNGLPKNFNSSTTLIISKPTNDKTISIHAFPFAITHHRDNVILYFHHL